MEIKQDLFAKPNSIFDTHAHYDDEAFDGIRDEILESFPEKGVGYIINNSTDLDKSAENCLSLSAKHKICYTAIGLHPELPERYRTVLDENKLRKLLHKHKVVAVGEIGLDYHFSSENKELQKFVFKRQCIIAKELGLPVIVHDRDAHGDTLDILRDVKPKGSVHCFSGSKEMALELVKLGLHIGVGGVITFKNARKLVETVEAIPLESILLETDAPYLAPVPFRGSTCLSSYIYYVALKIAEIKSISVDEVLAVTMCNAKALFNII